MWPFKRKKPLVLDKSNRNERALFADRGVVYPRDENHGGAYMDLPGRIIERNLGGVPNLTVETEKGTFCGFLEDDDPRLEFAATAEFAIIRCCDWGGGFYPDNRIRTLSTTPLDGAV
jgi:hypothetical protein